MSMTRWRGSPAPCRLRVCVREKDGDEREGWGSIPKPLPIFNDTLSHVVYIHHSHIITDDDTYLPSLRLSSSSSSVPTLSTHQSRPLLLSCRPSAGCCPA